MLKRQNLLAFSLAVLMMIAPVVASAAEASEKMPQAKAEYVSFEGVVEEINEKDEKTTIRIENEEKEDALIVHLNKETLVFENTKFGKVALKDIKKGDKVEVFNSRYTPVALSMPAQLTPEMLVIKTNEEPLFTKLDIFDNKLVSSGNDLKLLLDEKVEVVDLKGEKVEEVDLYGAKLIVFYDITTMSIPAQTVPKKVILVEKFDQREVTNKETVIINNEEVILLDEIYETKDGVVMIPLRQIVEALGYKVDWNGKEQAIEITKGPQWSRFKVGENNYNFAKMAMKLEKAPELKNEKTYVPMSILNEVLRLDTVLIAENGQLIIK